MLTPVKNNFIEFNRVATTMPTDMCGIGIKNHQIFNLIICFYPINMVNNFIWGKKSSKKFFYNKSMFLNCISFAFEWMISMKNLYISMTSNISSIFKTRSKFSYIKFSSARMTTKSGRSQSCLINSKKVFTKKTFDKMFTATPKWITITSKLFCHNNTSAFNTTINPMSFFNNGRWFIKYFFTNSTISFHKRIIA